MSAVLENAKAVLSELAALHKEGWCACQSSTLPARVEAALGELIAALSSPPADDVPEVHLDQVPMLIAELRDAVGDRTDWSEDLFARAADALDALSSPPADDVREALAKRIADEVEYRVRTAVTLAMNGHEYEQHVAQGRESVAAILAEVRPYGTVTDTEARAKAWDEGFALATRNNPNRPHPLAKANPYRGEARS